MAKLAVCTDAIHHHFAVFTYDEVKVGDIAGCPKGGAYHTGIVDQVIPAEKDDDVFRLAESLAGVICENVRIWNLAENGKDRTQ